MSFEHGRGSTESWITSEIGGRASAGKRTLTGQLQLRARGDAGAAPAEDPVTNYHGLERSTVADDAQAIAAHGISGAATAMPYAEQIQRSFGRHSIAGIDAHLGGAASDATAALGAHGYATGSSVAFAGAPSLHTAAHEAAHVIQQRAGVHLKGGVGESGDTHERHADAVADAVVRGESAEHLLDQYSGSGGGGGVQFSLVRPAEVMPGMGTFNVDFQTRNAATPGPGQRGGLDGFIQFTPMAGAPNSNVIGIIQIGKGTNAGNPASDRAAGSIPANAAPRGALGQPGLATADDAATGVVGGFSTDVLHTGGTTGTHPAGQPLSPRYAVEPTTPANQAGAWGGSTVGPRGGTGGIGELSAGGLTPGFKRSDLAEDIRSVQLYDTPASSGEADFEFESVVKGEDTGTIYGTCLWGFGVRSGATVNEHISFAAGTSATFDNALERHRDFYTHEPVVIYFAFDHDDVDGVQNAKITALAEYLRRNPAVVMTLDGFADTRGDAAYNVRLSERRVASVRAAIAAAHPAIPAAQIVSNTVVPAAGGAAASPNAGGHGEGTGATDATSEVPAGTGDQGGNAANGADQDREANRQFNRRVTISFSHPAGTGPAAPGGVANPAPTAPAGP